MPPKSAPTKTATKSFPPSRVSSFGVSTQKKDVHLPSKSASKVKNQNSTQNNNSRTKVTGKPNSTNIAASKAEKPSYDKDAELKFEAMIKGDLRDLPPLPRSIVRIFLSSTFSDTKVERNRLSSEVYPKLRDYCSELGLDFQVVDLRWGVVDQAQNDHSATKICLLEIENCQRVSLGPNFIAFVSHRYGGQPLPTELSVKQYELIENEVKLRDLPNGELLSKWFWRDDNSIPPNYVLQNVSTNLPYFADQTPGNEQLALQDSETWTRTLDSLKILFRDAADSLFYKKQISSEDHHVYYKSVTECEIENGIINNKSRNDQTLFYHRKLTDLTSDIDNEVTQKYIECVNKNSEMSVNLEVQTMLNCLVDDKVGQTLSKANFKSFTVPWKPDGISVEQHDQYLNQFCIKFTSDVINLITKAKHEKETKIRHREYYSRYDEILHHLKFCVSKCETFCGQKEILEKAKEYILSETNRKPLIISAKSGAGKTSLMAMIMKNLKCWINSDFIGIIRFLGTSPDTINIYNVLRSVCGQIADEADTIMEPVSYKKMSTIVPYIPRFLRSMSTKLKKPIVILLDSIDQLSDDHEVFLMNWLPLFLPPNVKIILSTLPEEHGILQNLKKLLNESGNYLELPILPPETGKEIIQKYLNKKKRCITPNQMELLLSQFNKVPTPLYLKLLLDEASTWGSYTSEHTIKTSSTIRQAVNLLFDELETKFGHQLIKSALGFITIGFNGLSEIELEDGLSCDNLVLDEVYKYHDPPVPDMIRIPPVLWARIRFDIKEYLVERLSQGKTTVYWYHRQFIEAASERYVSGDDKYRLHQILFELFAADDGIFKDIYLGKRKLLMKSADRQVTPQSLNSTNARKLECMLHHLNHGVQVISLETAKQRVFCNLHFIHTFISCFCTQRFIQECDDFLVPHPDEEIKFVRDFVNENPNTTRNKQVLAGYMLASINPQDKYQSLKLLLQQCRKLLETHQLPVLIPMYPCLSKRSSVTSSVESVPGSHQIVSVGVNFSLLNKLDDTKESGELFLYNSTENTMSNLDITAGVNLVASFSLSDQKLAICNGDVITIINPNTLKRKTKPLQGLVVTKLFFSMDSTHIGVIGSNSEMRLFLVKDLSVISTLKLNDIISDIYCTEEPDARTIIVGQDKSTLKGFIKSKAVHGKNGQQKVVDIPEANSKICSCVNGDNVIISFDTTLNIYNMESLELVNQVDLPNSQSCPEIDTLISSLSIPQVLVFCGHHIFIVDVTRGAIIQEILHDGVIFSKALSPDNDVVAIGGQEEITVYSLDTGKQVAEINIGKVPITQIGILDNNMIVSDIENDLKVVYYKQFAKSQPELKDSKEQSANDLIQYMDIVSMAVSNCQEILVTSHEDGVIRLWKLHDASLYNSYDKNAKFDQMLLKNTDVVLALDKSTNLLQIFGLETGGNIFKDELPDNIIAMTLNENKTNAYIVSKSDKMIIYTLDLKTFKISNSLNVQKMFEFIKLEIFLTASERFLIFKGEVSKSEKEAIQVMWKKAGNRMSSQYHPNRLSAVDVTAKSGAVLHCYRHMTKTPSLCESAAPYKGNVVMFAARRHAIYWDIPTGKCDQNMSKSSKHVMVYRPDWAGKSCKGHNTCFLHSSNKTQTIVGSQDGYVINYSYDTGLPIGMKAPSTKHLTEVSHIGISCDSKWIASVCLNGVIKLWSPETGDEIFSFSTKQKIEQLQFSSKSNYLVLRTQPPQPRILIFQTK